jgi:hypothetical protein
LKRRDYGINAWDLGRNDTEFFFFIKVHQQSTIALQGEIIGLVLESLPLRVCSHPILMDKKTNQNFSHHTLQLSLSPSRSICTTFLSCPLVSYPSTACQFLTYFQPGDAVSPSQAWPVQRVVCSIPKSHILQPFFAARHGFLLNDDGSSEEAAEEDVERASEKGYGLLETEDEGLLDTEDGLLETEEGLTEVEDELVETGDDSLLETEDDGLPEAKDDESLAEEVESVPGEGDGLSTSDDAPVEEEEREEDKDCTDEKAGFLDNVGTAGLELGVVVFDKDFGRV